MEYSGPVDPFPSSNVLMTSARLRASLRARLHGFY
jgi:hypothetical protein